MESQPQPGGSPGVQSGPASEPTSGPTSGLTLRPAPPGGFEAIERAVADLKAGKAVVVVDDEDRENEGDLNFAAERATPELVSFMVRYTSGYICVALTEDDCDRLDLPPMYHSNGDSFRTAFTVTVDAKQGITTGISATDRAHTIRLLASAEAHASDFVRPGHGSSAAREPFSAARPRHLGCCA